MNPNKNITRTMGYALGATSILMVLTLWSALAGFDMVSPAKLPAPWNVASAWWALAFTKGQLGGAIFASVSRIGIAAVLMILVGFPMGILMGSSKAVNAFFSPLVDPFRSAPIVAVIPILVMWFGIGETMKVVFLWLGAVVYLVPMVRDAIQAVDSRWFKAAKDRGASDTEALVYAVLPMAKPRIADALITSISVMWTYITVAELVNADSGIGKLIETYRKVSQMDSVFAGILTIMVLALISYTAMVALRNKLYPDYKYEA